MLVNIFTQRVLNSLLSRYALYVVLLCFGLLTSNFPEKVVLLFPTIGCVFYLLGQLKSRLFTSGDCALFCVFLFFVVSPLQRFTNVGLESTTVRGMEVSAERILETSLLVTATIAMGYTGAKCASMLGLGRRRDIRFDNSERAVRLGNLKLPLALIGGLTSLLYVISIGGVSEVLASRQLKTVNTSGTPVPAFLLSVATLAAMIQLSNIKSCFRLQGAVGATILIFSQLCLLGLLVNPVNSARYVNAAIWMPIVILAIGQRANFKMFYFGLIFIIVVVMPIMSITSRFGVEGLLQGTKMAEVQSVFILQDMDVFETLVFVFDYAKQEGWGYGKNLTAILLFFVPRNIWPEKPVVGGLDIGELLKRHYGAGTENLSFFVGGDLYLDFGWAGVIICSFCLSFLLCSIPFWTIREGNIEYNDILLCGSIPILIRGPVGATVGAYLSIWLALQLSVLVIRLLQRVARE